MNKHYYNLFKKQVNIKPNKIAISDCNNQLTYEELDIKINQYATNLIYSGVGKNSIIGVLLERTVDWIAYIIAILKIGCTYLPISTQYPINRIEYIINDINLKYIVVDNPKKYSKLKNIMLIDLKLFLDNNKSLFNDVITYSDISYVLYTSGSTGNPKGVMVKHKGMLNHIYAKINDLTLNSNDVIAQNASQSFDISIWQSLTSLLIGGQTHIMEDDIVNNPRKFIQEINRKNISILEVVPSYLNLLLKLVRKNNLWNLKYLISTGEMLHSTIANRWLDLFPSIPIVNAYGPTEASDDITHFIMKDKCLYDNIPIGKPIQNMNVYIVNDKMELCNLNEKGEICVSGIGIAKGYINDSKKTNMVFIENPFCKKYKVLYKTGDIGSWIDNNIIMYYGRKDNGLSALRAGHR
jgi:amino acid adenylation domain-containing protein